MSIQYFKAIELAEKQGLINQQAAHSLIMDLVDSKLKAGDKLIERSKELLSRWNVSQQ